MEDEGWHMTRRFTLVVGIIAATPVIFGGLFY